jgi:molybdate transport system substrate-binding protein
MNPQWSRRLKPARHGVAVCAFLLLVAVPAAAQEVVVSAASSLAEVIETLAARHAAATGDEVVVNLAASNTLARQIAAGAPVDVFISADEAQMDAVTPYLVPGTRVDLLSNVLAVAVPADRPRRFGSLADLAAADVRRIAVGDPVAVPVGVYARQHLESLGLWDVLEPRLVPAASARLALAAVENGAVDAAIVYRTDIRTASRAAEALVVPAADGPRIVYAAALVRDGDAPVAARRFLAFLRSEAAATVFEAAGFVPLGPER